MGKAPEGRKEHVRRKGRRRDGGAQGIGRAIAREFAQNGARVAVIDVQENPYFVGDVGDEGALERFAAKVAADFGRVDFLIHNAPPP